MNIQNLVDFLEESWVGVNFIIKVINSYDDDALLSQLGLNSDDEELQIFTPEILILAEKYYKSRNLAKVVSLYYNLKDKIEYSFGEYVDLYDDYVKDDIILTLSDLLSDPTVLNVLSKNNVDIRYLSAGAEKRVYAVNSDFVIKTSGDWSKMSGDWGRHENRDPIESEVELYKSSETIRKYLPRLYAVSKLGMFAAFEYLDGTFAGLDDYIQSLELEIPIPSIYKRLEIPPIITYHFIIYIAHDMNFLSENIDSLGDQWRHDESIEEFSELSLEEIIRKIELCLSNTENIIKEITKKDILSSRQPLDTESEPNVDELALGEFLNLIHDITQGFYGLEHYEYKDLAELNRVVYLVEPFLSVQNSLQGGIDDEDSRILEILGKEFTSLVCAYCIRLIFEDPILTGLYELSNNMSGEWDIYMDLDMFAHNIFLVDESEHGVPFKIIDFGGFARYLDE